MSIENPIKRSGICDEVANQLQKQIAAGKFKKGDKLPSEPELMQQFGVGRSSVREAIRILATSGLLRVQQGLGTFVAMENGTPMPWYKRLESSSSNDLNEVRQLLELKIAEKAAINRNQKDITILTRLLKKRLEAAEKNLPDECIDFDIQFHIAIADAAKNEILADLYKNIATQIKKSFRQAYTNTEMFMLKHTLHHDLLQSIIDKDPQKAWECVAQITGQTSSI
jgi:DNA-binding FadR family transcriptional regulator